MPSQGVPTQWADCDDLRTQFTLAMSAMYKQEVPLYMTLVRIVDDVNASIRAGTLDDQVITMRFGDACQPRLNIERHGAVRVGTAEELRTISAVFRLLGMFPVGYYDLSQREAGLPMHATCFRPVTREALRKNPFRIFTSVLRPDLIKSPEARDLATSILQRRSIFSAELVSMLQLADSQGGRITVDQSPWFIQEALKIFQWKGTTMTSEEEYQTLRSEHPVLADIASFSSCHINHLTPRTLDITAAQVAMEEEGLQVKECIEGPPPRKCPILLRQTSFLAVEEMIKFRSSPDEPQEKKSLGSHRARFGEIEERGAAVTPSGRQLYDTLTIRSRQCASLEAQSSSTEEDQLSARERYDRTLARVFSEYPDNWQELRKQRLVYFTYQCSQSSHIKVFSTSLEPMDWPTSSLDDLVLNGTLVATPITYEDFLPLSAAGIFRSNLGTPAASKALGYSKLESENTGRSDMRGLEEAIGFKILDSDYIYKSTEEASIQACAQMLRINIST